MDEPEAAPQPTAPAADSPPLPEVDKLVLDNLVEDYDFEVKRAAGKSGKGELPAAFWETYSGMANTEGGVVILGISQSGKKFHLSGIEDIPRVTKMLWDGLNNRHTISVNLLANGNVETVEVEGKHLLRISVPRANRHQRPVYVGRNPMNGTFRRNGEGDYRCDEETVRRMLAEQSTDAPDGRVLAKFGLADLQAESVAAYRNQFRGTKPDHPWNRLSDTEFLRSIGAWRKDRDTGGEGLTLAGLLMFGKLPAILEAVPNYVVDFQEQTGSKNEIRWTDRVTTDGTWSGNLFDFFGLVFGRLTRDIKVPFKLRGSKRVDDSPVHEALREALVNTIIHADYTGRCPVLIVKRPEMFGFRNPGMMRIPAEDAVRGGLSDCRNRAIQKMFQMVGLAEQSGSGIPKIYQNWKQQHWRPPRLFDTAFPVDSTVMTLRTVSLLPDETLKELDRRFGGAFHEMKEEQRLALATVHVEGKVTNARLKAITNLHSRDITGVLTGLVKQGYLDSDGATSGTFYFFPGEPPSEEESLEGVGNFQQSRTKRFQQLVLDSQQSIHESKEQHEEVQAALLPDVADWDRLMRVAAPIRARRKAPNEEVEAMIVKVCDGRFLTAGQLSNLLGRTVDSLSNHYLSQMVAAGKLALKHPETPNHPKQAYTVRTNVAS